MYIIKNTHGVYLIKSNVMDINCTQKVMYKEYDLCIEYK